MNPYPPWVGFLQSRGISKGPSRALEEAQALLFL